MMDSVRLQVDVTVGLERGGRCAALLCFTQEKRSGAAEVVTEDLELCVFGEPFVVAKGRCWRLCILRIRARHLVAPSKLPHNCAV